MCPTVRRQNSRWWGFRLKISELWKLIFHCMKFTSKSKHKIYLTNLLPNINNWLDNNVGSIPGLGRAPGEGNGYPLQYFDLENPKGHKESDTTEQLSLSDNYLGGIIIIIIFIIILMRNFINRNCTNRKFCIWFRHDDMWYVLSIFLSCFIKLRHKIVPLLIFKIKPR